MFEFPHWVKGWACSCCSSTTKVAVNIYVFFFLEKHPQMHIQEVCPHPPSTLVQVPDSL